LKGKLNSPKGENMALDFSKLNDDNKENIGEEIQEKTEEIKYDIVAERKKLNEELYNSKEINEIISSINLSDFNQLVNFGAKAADEISKASDIVLSNTSLSQVYRTSNVIKTLNKILEKVSIEEIKKEPGMLEKVFGSVQRAIEKLLSKYDQVGRDIDKVYVELKINEEELKTSNQILKTMFDSNVEYYQELVKYIIAGEKAVEEIKDQIKNREKAFEETKDSAIQFELSKLNQCLLVLEQRVQDLRHTEAVAILSIPQINSMAYNNVNLIRKINSAFIVTIPVFKQALAQAVILKRQHLQSQMLKALDEKTNKMIEENATNAIELSKETTKIATESSIKIETLEKSWKTIIDGINEIKALQEEMIKKCNEDKERLNAIKNEFSEKYKENILG